VWGIVDMAILFLVHSARNKSFYLRKEGIFNKSIKNFALSIVVIVHKFSNIKML
jgi:hypothetical protein